MRPRTGSRHRWVRGAAVITASLAALLAGLSPTEPASAQGSPEGILPPGDWTEEQANELLRMVSEAEEKLPQKFADSSNLPEGFVDIIAVTAGYSHYVNVGWFDDDHLFNPEYPESLVYKRNPDGTETIVAAMYFHNNGITMDNIPEEHQWLPGWHSHPELCSNEQGQVVGLAPNCPPGSGPADGPPMIHVWIVDNECGHRFGGLGVGGFHCDYEDHGGGHEHGGEEHAGDDHGDAVSEVGQPAPEVAGTPGFTG
jgi:hypothetical protein